MYGMRSWLVIAAIATATPAAAHDFYIEPSAHRISVNEELTLKLKVGWAKEIDEIPRSNTRIIRFDAVTADGVRPVGGKHGQSPAGHATFDKAGTVIVVYQSNHSTVELDAAKFEHYLVEEGLDEIIEERKKLGVTQVPARDSYARFVKSIITVGDGTPAGFDRRVGLEAELVPLTDPRLGGTAQFQLWWNDKPRAGATVDLIRFEKDHITSVAHAKTDADGKVSLAIPSNDRWLVATTLMRDAPQELNLEGDYESLWVSVTFETGKAKSHGGGCATSEPTSLGIALVLFVWIRRRRGN